ncbi:hypothetical protein WME91_53770 [Sorangium sp. So ce269]
MASRRRLYPSLWTMIVVVVSAPAGAPAAMLLASREDRAVELGP